MVGRLVSYWEGNFSGAMLNFQGVVVWKNTLVINLQELGMDFVSILSKHSLIQQSLFSIDNMDSCKRLSWTNDENKPNLIDSCIEPGIFLSVWPFHDEETLEISKKLPGSHEN